MTLNRSECAYLLDAEKPRINPDSIVVNCAAFTNTKACEQNREKAVEDNVIFAGAISEFANDVAYGVTTFPLRRYLAKTAHLNCRLKMTFLSLKLGMAPPSDWVSWHPQISGQELFAYHS